MSVINKLHLDGQKSLMAIVLFFLLYPGLGFSQTQPLSRNDKAQIEKSTASYSAANDAGNWKEASRHLNDIAYLHWEHNDYRKAIEYYEESLLLNDKLNNENGLAMLHNNLGMLYSDIGEYEKSLSYFEKTLAARRAFKNKEGIIAAIKNISVAQNNLGMYQESIDLLQEATLIARETNDPDQTSSCFMMLSEAYEKAGDVANTKHYYELYRSFQGMKQGKELERLQQLTDKDSILNQIKELESRKQQAELVNLQNQFDAASLELDQFNAEKRRLTDDLSKTQLQVGILEAEKESERLSNEIKLQSARELRNGLLVGSISLLLISFFIYRNYRREQKAKLVLAGKNDQINLQNQELDNLNQIIAKHNKRMQTELNVGREIQMSMIPSHFPDITGVDLFAALKPALEVGGDLYDFFKLDDDHLIFGIGDVSDKGVPAALFMAVTKTLVKTNANYSSLPGKILTQVNKELSADNESSMFVTYFLSVLNTRTGELTYCNAGHNPPLYIAQNGDLHKLETVHGPVLGAVEDYDYGQDSLIMKKDDQLVLFTDGVTEAMDSQQLQYSNDRLDQIFRHNGKHNSKESVESIMEDVGRFRGEAEQSDDITVLSLIYTGV